MRRCAALPPPVQPEADTLYGRPTSRLSGHRLPIVAVFEGEVDRLDDAVGVVRVVWRGGGRGRDCRLLVGVVDALLAALPAHDGETEIVHLASIAPELVFLPAALCVSAFSVLLDARGDTTLGHLEEGVHDWDARGDDDEVTLDPVLGQWGRPLSSEGAELTKSSITGRRGQLGGGQLLWRLGENAGAYS